MIQPQLLSVYVVYVKVKDDNDENDKDNNKKGDEENDKKDDEEDD